MARQLSPSLLGKMIEGIWHTGVVVFGSEYYLGGDIQRDRPGHTLAGSPDRVIPMGQTTKTQSEFDTFLRSKVAEFNPATYDLQHHNCNHFSNAACQFLLGRNIPDDILYLPDAILSTPLGHLFKPMVDAFSRGAGADPFASASAAPLLPTLDSSSAAPAESSSNLPISHFSCEALFRTLLSHLPLSSPEVAAHLSAVERMQKLSTLLQLSTVQVMFGEMEIIDILEAIEELFTVLHDDQSVPLIDLLRILCIRGNTASMMTTIYGSRLAALVESLTALTSSTIEGLTDDATSSSTLPLASRPSVPFVWVSVALLTNLWTVADGRSFLLRLPEDSLLRIFNAVYGCLHCRKVKKIRRVGALFSLAVVSYVSEAKKDVPDVDMQENHTVLLTVLADAVSIEDAADVADLLLASLRRFTEKDGWALEVVRSVGCDVNRFLTTPGLCSAAGRDDAQALSVRLSLKK